MNIKSLQNPLSTFIALFPPHSLFLSSRNQESMFQRGTEGKQIVMYQWFLCNHMKLITLSKEGKCHLLSTTDLIKSLKGQVSLLKREKENPAPVPSTPVTSTLNQNHPALLWLVSEVCESPPWPHREMDISRGQFKWPHSVSSHQILNSVASVKSRKTETTV